MMDGSGHDPRERPGGVQTATRHAERGTERGGERIDQLVGRHAALLSERLAAHRAQLFTPDARKKLRRFTSGEVAELLGVTDAYLRKLDLEGRGPAPETGPGGRRLYAPEDIRSLREMLEATAKTPGTYLPGRRVHAGGTRDHAQVIAVINFKGGSGKTTTAAHLAQKAALDGYRVLAVDLDPQASLSGLHGVQPEIDLDAGGTLYDAIRYDDPVPLERIIQQTYFAGLDLVPGNLELMEFEHETPRVLAEGRHQAGGPLFFTRIGEALAQVVDGPGPGGSGSGDSRPGGSGSGGSGGHHPGTGYDLVVLDCPPQLGFLTMSALSAATAVLVTVHPQMLDVMSMSQFLLMTSNLLEVVAGAGGDMGYDWLRYVITRFEPSDGPQAQMVDFLRALFGEHVLETPILKSTAISDAGITKQTLYEVEKSQFGRATYARARASLDAVTGEIEDLIQAAWGRG